MGIKKITEKQREFKARESALNELIKTFDAARRNLEELEKTARKYEAELERLRAERAAIGKRLAGADTLGAAPLEKAKRDAIANCSRKDFSPWDWDLSAARKYVKEAEDDFERDMAAWIDKQSASFPKQVKKGMVFKDYKLNRLYEAVSDEYPAKNQNLSGDEARWADFAIFDLRTGKIVSSKVSNNMKNVSPMNKVKFVKL